MEYRTVTVTCPTACSSSTYMSLAGSGSCVPKVLWDVRFR